MSHLIRKSLKGIGFSVILAAGLLAILHIEMPHEDSRADWRKPDARPQSGLSRLYKSASHDSRSSTVKDQLRSAMAGDELKGKNPFEHLSSEDALNRIFHSSVASFERETLRSPSYNAESGYDLLHYEIRHSDGSTSSILAFVDRETVELVVMTPKGGMKEYALFRNGDLEEINLLMPEESITLLAQRLESAIPFLSVSR